jgi:hypothetical protein
MVDVKGGISQHRQRNGEDPFWRDQAERILAVLAELNKSQQ